MARPTDGPTDRAVPDGDAAPFRPPVDSRGAGVRRGPRRRAKRSLLPWVVLLSGWAVAAIATLATVLIGLRWAPLHAEVREREQAHATAGELARLTTFEGERIEEWVADGRDLATDDYAREIAELFDPELRDTLREAGAVSEGEIADLFVQAIDGDEAGAFAVVRQTITSRDLEGPVEDELRMDIALLRVDGEWLVSDVEVLAAAERTEVIPGAEAETPEEGEPALND